MESPTDVMTIAEVLSRLEVLDGRTVWVRGVLSLQFESNELRDRDAKLWVDLVVPEDVRARIPALNGRQVVVRGRVDRSETGHLGLWPAGLTIDRVMKAKDAV
jgi:hypothetical protein